MGARAAGRQCCEGRGRGQDRGVSWCAAITAWLVHGQQIGSSGVFGRGSSRVASLLPPTGPVQLHGDPCTAGSTNATPAAQMQRQYCRCNSTAVPGWISCISAASSWSKLTDARAADKGGKERLIMRGRMRKAHSKCACTQCRLAGCPPAACTRGWAPAGSLHLWPSRAHRVKQRQQQALTRLNVEGHARS